MVAGPKGKGGGFKGMRIDAVEREVGCNKGVGVNKEDGEDGEEEEEEKVRVSMGTGVEKVFVKKGCADHHGKRGQGSGQHRGLRHGRQGQQQHAVKIIKGLDSLSISDEPSSTDASSVNGDTSSDEGYQRHSKKSIKKVRFPSSSL